LKSNIEKWVKRYGPISRYLQPLDSKNLIQCEKEVFAAYLAGSRQGIPPLYFTGDRYYQLTIYYAYTYIALRIASADVLPAIAQIITWSSIFLWLPVSFIFGRQLGWCGPMCGAVYKIRKQCKIINVEEGVDIRNQLEWWIESILIEESDSDALAKERMEVIIAPILRAIRC
jgi:hypothetical protein